ncbi:MAG: hypothetical protein GF401_20410 [Chitinivibrionales bacterium]|nr:hypothetical protein [Chitinivibrionales bacterium]
MLFSSDTSLGEKLTCVTRLGRQKNATRQQQHALRKLRDNVEENMYIRGYAAWALDQCIAEATPRKSAIYHVDCNNPSADDTNPGSQEKPFKTIQKAAETLRSGDRAVIHEGVYRELVQPFCGGDSPDTMITYCAAQGETPVIKAMDIWTPEWRNEGNGLWSATYVPHSWDSPDSPGTQIPNNRCEQIFADGKLCVHVEKQEELTAREGTMWIDNENTRLWIHLPSEQIPSERLIERSTRPQCFAPAVRGLGYITISGLTMIGGAAHKWTGGNWNDINQTAVLSTESGHHWIIENNTIEYGNAQGLSIGVGGFARPKKEIPIITRDTENPETPPPETRRGGTLARRNKVNYHGISGIVGIGDTINLIIEDNEVIGNDLKNNRGTCEEAGIKFHGVKKSIFRGNLVKDNNSHGVWLDCNCEENRITRNILIDNTDNQIFHELSQGPLLVDNNVIVETKEDSTSTGFYTHDGNRALFTTNYIYGCKLGVRIRALFHRMHHGKHTATSHNHIYNNIIENCREAPVSLMPEAPRCEDNSSESNFFWNSGAPVFLRVENTSDVGMKWEETDIGKALGYEGGGDRLIPVEYWSRFLSMDTKSIILPPELLFGNRKPASLRDALVRFSITQNMKMECGYYPSEPVDTKEFLCFAPLLGPDARLLRSLWTAPYSGFQIWETGSGAREIMWRRGKESVIHPLEEFVLLKEPLESLIPPVEIALGDSTTIPLEQGWRVVRSDIPCSIPAGMLSLSAPMEKTPGRYAVVLSNDMNWTVVRVTISPACTLDKIDFSRHNGNAVLITLTNHGNNPVDGDIMVVLNDEKRVVPSALESHTTEEFRVPVSCPDAGKAFVTVKMGNSTIETDTLVGFAAACRSGSWDRCPRFDMDSFPGGLFPEGAEAFVFYMGRLHAGWRARYDDTGLYVRVEVEHTEHIAKRLDMEGIHTGDGVKIALKGKPGDRATVVGMALLSESKEPTWGFCKSGNEAKYPVGRYPDMDASVIRKGNLTVYEAKIIWNMINLSHPPAAGTSIPFSVFVSCKDSDAKYGLQWFYGIKYDQWEGDETRMGRLWFE